MTESENIAFAKSFIDKLASSINPIDNTPAQQFIIDNLESVILLKNSSKTDILNIKTTSVN